MSSSPLSQFSIQNLKVVNEAKPGVPILTGIGYFDHMLDQFNSHAQVGIGLQVDLIERLSDAADAAATATATTPTPTTPTPTTTTNVKNKNRLASLNQVTLCTLVGTDLGVAMVQNGSLDLATKADGAESRFCCPLDEALVECIIRKPASGTGGSLKVYELAPYGRYPEGQGRTKIGQWETFAMEAFWKALATSSHLEISLTKLRGDNGHHIAESSFKAFSRALRNYVDASKTVFAPASPNDHASIALTREATIERSTKETSISVKLRLNGTSQDTSVQTGIPMLDAFFTTLATEAKATLQIKCDGDLWVDDHHTAEDVSIAVGQCLTEALGTKAGLNRMWVADATEGEAAVEVTMDLSNRPYLGHNLHDTFGLQEYVDPDTDNGGHGNPLSCEMMEHVLDSLVMNGRMTVHIMETAATISSSSKGEANVKDTVLAIAKAFGQALRVCSMVDQRRAGQTASSKGTLSV